MTEKEIEEVDFAAPITKPALLKKLVSLMNRVGAIQKDGVNDFHKYRFVSGAAVAAKVQPALVELELVAVPRFSIVERSGDLVTVKCILSIFDSVSGAALFPEPQALGSGTDKSDKAVQKAETAAYKRAFMGLLCIPSPDDPEADSSVDKPEPQRPRALPAAALPPRMPPPPQGIVEPNPVIGASWLSKKIEVANVEKKSPNPKAPWLVTVLDQAKPMKLFGERNYERIMDLMKLGQPIEVKYTTRVDKWGEDQVIEEIPHAEVANAQASADPF